MSWNKQIAQKRKLLNSDIISKTQIALEAIKNYEARSYRFLDKQKLTNHPFHIMKQIDHDYSKLHSHKQLKLDRVLKIQIFPYNQQYYFINTQLVIFPVRIFLRNVRNEGVLYVGYDRPFPGVDKSPQNARNDKQYQSQLSTYDYKFSFNKDIMCLLKNDRKKPIQKIFLTFMAKKQLLMFNLKYDYIGYEGLQWDLINQNRPKRALTEGNLQTLKPSLQQLQQFIGKSSNGLQKINLKKLYQNEGRLMRSKTQVQSSDEFNLYKNAYILENTTSYSPNKSRKKNFLQQNLIKITAHKRQKSQQFQQQKKQKKTQQLQRIKANRQQIQEYKEKQFQIKQTANKLKKFIQNYQRIYKQQKIRDRKVVLLLGPLIYISKFMKNSNKLYNKQTKSLLKTISVRYIIKKFTSNLKRKHIQDILLIGNFKLRMKMSIYQIFQVGSIFVLPQSTSKSASIMFSTFQTLEPALVLNHSLNQASKYRQAVRIIQKNWKIKYINRLIMLETFSHRHVDEMIKEYPHLKLGLGTFRQGNYSHKICYQYLVDQSHKFRHIYDAYSKRVQQIDDFIQENYKIKQFNKNKPESKWKKYLDIPKKPTPPQHRIFRNLDILKSMIRGWFEIEYKKILKKNISLK